MDPASIGFLIASAALTAHTTNQAAKRQQAAARQAQLRQLNAQNLATEAAARRAIEFDPKSRNDKQADIAQELTGQLQQEVAQPQITAQGVQVGTTIPNAEGGTDYLKAKARETAKSTESLRQLAALMGRTGAASELRRGEAVRMGDTAGEIGRIQTGANNIFGADQIGIGAAGQQGIGPALASAALSAYGTSRLVGSGMKGGNPFPEHGLPSGPTGGWV